LDDERLERRLRRDPTTDPPHRVGAFRDRLAARGLSGSRAPRRLEIQLGGPPALVATLVVVVALIAGRVLSPSAGPGGTSPAPSATVAPTPTPLPSAGLQAMVIDWAHRRPAHRAMLAVVGPIGEIW